jgi:hypothetical protein
MNKSDWVVEEALRRDAARSRGLGLRLKKLESSHAGPAATGSNYFCREIAENYVAGDKVRAAIAMLELCQRKLKIPTLYLTWYTFCSPRDPGARSLGPRPTKAFVELGAVPKIYLRADLSLMDLQLAAAHECHHIWIEAQPKDRYASLHAGDRENCADAFSWIMWDDLRVEPGEVARIVELGRMAEVLATPNTRTRRDGRTG